MERLVSTRGRKGLKLSGAILLAVEESAQTIHEAIGKFGPSQLSKNVYDSMAEQISVLLAQTYLKDYYDSKTGKLRWKRGQPNQPIPIEWLWTAKALLSLELVRQSSLIHTARGRHRDESWDFAKGLVRHILRRKGA